MATTSAVQTAPLQTSGVQPDAARRRKRSERRFQSPADVIVFIALCLGAFTMLLPLAWMLSTSLKTQENVFSLPPQWIPDPAELGNYLRIWDAGPLLTGIINSAIVSLTVVTIGTITSCFAAYGFSKMRIPGKNRSEEHTSELSHVAISYAVFCLKNKQTTITDCCASKTMMKLRH